MAEAGKNTLSDYGTVDMQIIDCGTSEEEDNFFYTVPTQNRFGDHYAQQSGRGSDSQTARIGERRPKRKKVSSSSVETGSFSGLSTDEKLECLFEVVNRNNQVLTDIKHDQVEFCKTTVELQDGMIRLNERVDRVVKVAEHQDRCMRMLAYRSIDTEARGRRNNIIFWGITERSGIDAETLVLNFVQEMLEVDTSGMVIDRAHRLGTAPTSGHRADAKRPIIAKFRDYQDTETVIRRAFKLKGTPFGMDRDYPKEIAVARKQLYQSEEARKARERRNKVQIRYPARLYVNGQLERDMFPEWREILSMDRIQGIDLRVAFKGGHNQGDLSGGRTDRDGASSQHRATGDNDEEAVPGSSGGPESRKATGDQSGGEISSGHAPSSPSVNKVSRDTSRDDSAVVSEGKWMASGNKRTNLTARDRSMSRGRSRNRRRRQRAASDKARKSNCEDQSNPNGSAGDNRLRREARGQPISAKNSNRETKVEHEVESTHL